MLAGSPSQGHKRNESGSPLLPVTVSACSPSPHKESQMEMTHDDSPPVHCQQQSPDVSPCLTMMRMCCLTTSSGAMNSPRGNLDQALNRIRTICWHPHLVQISLPCLSLSSHNEPAVWMDDDYVRPGHDKRYHRDEGGPCTLPPDEENFCARMRLDSLMFRTV